MALAHLTLKQATEGSSVAPRKTSRGSVVKQEFRFYFGLNCCKRGTRKKNKSCLAHTLADQQNVCFSQGGAWSVKARFTLLYSEEYRSLLKLAHWETRAKYSTLEAAGEVVKLSVKWNPQSYLYDFIDKQIRHQLSSFFRCGNERLCRRVL